MENAHVLYRWEMDRSRLEVEALRRTGDLAGAEEWERWLNGVEAFVADGSAATATGAGSAPASMRRLARPT